MLPPCSYCIKSVLFATLGTIVALACSGFAGAPPHTGYVACMLCSKEMGCTLWRVRLGWLSVGCRTVFDSVQC
jgi:hypothetical protein